MSRRSIRLPAEVSRILYVRNLPYKISADELYDIFGKYGTVRQIRKGNAEGTKGTSFVIYDDIYDAKNALDHLSGFNVAGRYLVNSLRDKDRRSEGAKGRRGEGAKGRRGEGANG
ncbi:splicing factor 3B subunit 6, putative [Plasmodium malariae]|uniref:Splicing factor 3B subunit 6, putative n=1 Tax=Plasmodium malariae TaxID=5858 RepID=A0A1A8WFT0_PLAMA|nr:splicing factor 3B subunit 6, putative [Plasmodium malariae]